MKRFLIPIWLLFSTLALMGQVQPNDLVVRFENLTVKDRLPSQRVLCVCQDQNGFMWFGTEEGLCRYDGHHFVEFFADINDPYSLHNQAIRSIVEDRFGNLWIGTDGGGLHYFDQKTWKFFSYPLPFQPLDNANSRPGLIYAILRTSEEDYWIGSYGQGLYRIPAYDSPREVFRRCGEKNDEGVIQIVPNGQENGLNDLNVYCLYEDSNQDIWIGTDDYGTLDGGALHRLIKPVNDSQGFTFQRFRSVPDDPHTLGSNYIMSVYEDSKGRFWVCNWDGGLNLLDRKTGEVQRFSGMEDRPGMLNAHDVYSIVEDNNGILWVATYGGGISRIAEENGSLTFIPYRHQDNKQNSLIGDFVRQLFVDQGGLLWAITWKSGISRIRVNQNPFTQIPLPGHQAADTLSEVVRDIRVLNDHTVAIYTEEQGFFRLNLDPKGARFSFEGLSDPQTWPDRPIFQTQFARHYSSDRAFRNLIKDSRVFLEDSKGNLWFAKDQVLYKLSFTSEGYEQENYQRNSQDPSALKGYHVTGIAEDRDQQIWVSTFDGLNLYSESDNSFIHYTMKDGLPGNAISAMQIDDNNYLWLATENGLARFDPRYRGSLNYYSADGMPFTEFCSRVGFGMEDFQVFPASCKLPDGGMLFSSVQHGLLYFRPQDIFRNLSAPRTWITELRIMNKVVSPENVKSGIVGEDGQDISFARSLVLNPEEKSFTFTVSVIDYFNSDHTQFGYRMLPIDESWRYMPPGVESVNFSMLPAGDYVFETIGANADGIWSEEPTALHIHIDDYWYNQIWFKLLAGIILLLIIMVIIIRSKQRSQILQALSIERLRREEQDRFTKMRLNFYTNVTHEFRTQLTLILGPLGKLERLISGSDGHTDLKIMKRNGLSLLNLVNQLMDYRKLEMRAMQLQVEEGNLSQYVQGICELFGENILSREIRFQFSSEPENIIGYFDRSAVDKIIFNLLSNSFKYTEKKGRISVRLEAYSNEDIERVKILIQDNGKGISGELKEKVFDRFYQADHNHPGSGIGLSIVKSLTEMHYGRISLDSQLNQGSIFTIDIPISRSAYREADISDRPSEQTADFSAYRPAVISPQEREGVYAGEVKKQFSVLVVEDNLDMLNFITGIIEHDYRVMRAQNAETALNIISSREPDIILTDLMMAGIGGMELVKMLKSDDRYTHIPIIIISALEQKENELMGLRQGAEDFIHKPFEPEILLLKIGHRLQSRNRFKKEFVQSGTRQLDYQSINERDQAFLNKLMQEIDEHFSNPSFGVKNLVQQMGMSHSVLLRKVKSLTGQSINELIVMIRLEKAHEVLHSGNYPVKEVAYQVGFSDPKYFSTRFKKKYGCSPSELN